VPSQKSFTGGQLVIHQRSSICSIGCTSNLPLHHQIVLPSKRKSKN
jgi:hypothetical protein